MIFALALGIFFFMFIVIMIIVEAVSKTIYEDDESQEKNDQIKKD